MTRALVSVLALLALLVAARFGVGWAEAGSWLHRLLGVVPQAIVALAMGRVVLQFERGDRPRRAWILLTAGAAILGASRFADGPPVEWLVMTANLLFLAGVADCLAVVRESGFAPRLEGSARGLVGGAISVAAIATSIALWELRQRLLEQEWTGVQADWTRVAAVFGLSCDALVFVLSVILVGLLLQMRGALAAVPYLLISLSGALFLTLDLVGIFVVEGWGYGGFGPWLGATGQLAWALYAGAGLAQARVLHVARV